LPFCRTLLYDGVDQLEQDFAHPVRQADLVVVGSYVPDGVAVARFVLATAQGITAFYDIDTPVTLAKLAKGDDEYLSADLIPGFDLYLSFTGGPTLARLEQVYGARMARALPCTVDPDLYFPEPGPVTVDLGYLGTWSADRQPKLEQLLPEPARRWPAARFAVAAPQYPADVAWPGNVERIEHVPPHRPRAFYGSQRFTLNITRADMVAAGHSPSVRLFEAAACGTPIISDVWPGLETVLEPHEELMIARTSEDVVRLLREVAPYEAQRIARAARARVLSAHSSERRADELIAYLHGAHRGAGSPDEARKVASA